MARGPAPGWPVHGSTVDSPRGRRPLRATEARPEGGDGTGTTRRDRETTHPSPDDGEEVARRLAARVETERAQRGVTEGQLTRARTMVRRRCTDDGASAVERVRRGNGGEQERA
jgi:hypothetical protein